MSAWRMTLTLLFAGNNVAEAELDLQTISVKELTLEKPIWCFCCLRLFILYLLFIVNQLPFMYI